jgi:hypothetical protein
MMKHKNYKNVWEIPEDFPQTNVIEAFYNPRVDEPSEFKWKKPHFENLQIFFKQVVGLEQIEVDGFISNLKREFKLRDSEGSGPKGLKKYFKGISTRGEIVSTRLKQSIMGLKELEKRKKKLRKKKEEEEGEDKGGKRPKTGKN